MTYNASRGLAVAFLISLTPLACSGTSTNDAPDGGGDVTDSGTSGHTDGGSKAANDAGGDGGTPTGPFTSGWRQVTVPAGFEIDQIVSNGTVAWAYGVKPGDPNTESSFEIRAWLLDEDGTLTQKWSYSDDEVLISNYDTGVIYPVDTSSCVFGGNGAGGVIGSADATGNASELDTSHAKIWGAYATSASDIWLGASSGVLHHFVSGADTYAPIHVALSAGEEGSDALSVINSVWAHGDRIYFTAGVSVLSVAAADVNDKKLYATVEIQAATSDANSIAGTQISGDGDLAFAHGWWTTFASSTPTPFFVMFDGTSWSNATPPSSANPTGLSVAAANDAWLVAGGIYRFDGSKWSQMTESGAPANVSSVAAIADGTAWFYGKDGLFIRR